MNSGLKALVASNDGDFLRLAAGMLTCAGHQVRTATDRGARIERLMRHYEHDVIVIDGRAGRGMRRLAGETARIPVVVVTEDHPPLMVHRARARMCRLDDLVATIDVVADDQGRRHERPALRLVR